MHELVSELQLVQSERRKADASPFYFLDLKIKGIYIIWLKRVIQAQIPFCIKKQK